MIFAQIATFRLDILEGVIGRVVTVKADGGGASARCIKKVSSSFSASEIIIDPHHNLFDVITAGIEPCHARGDFAQLALSSP